MKVRFLNCWVKTKDCFFRYSDGLVVLIAVVCLYAILQIKFNFAFWVGYTDNPTAINEVITNLSYSYLAAFVFYVLTVTLPHWKMKSKVKMALDKKIRLIESNYKACAESIVPFPKSFDINVTKEGLVELFKARSYLESCRLNILGTSFSVIAYINIKHDENKRVLSELLEYKQWLSSDTIVMIEDIRNADLKNIIISLTQPALIEAQAKDEATRAMLASAVYDVWNIAKKLKA